MSRRALAILLTITALAASAALAGAAFERDMPRGSVTFIRVTD